MRQHSSILIWRPPADVYAQLADPSRLFAWTDHGLRSEAAPREGQPDATHLKLTVAKGRSGEETFDVDVTGRLRDRMLEVRSEAYGVRLTTHLDLQPARGGRATRVQETLTLETQGAVRRAGMPILWLVSKAGLRRGLRRVRRVVETPGALGPRPEVRELPEVVPGLFEELGEDAPA